MFFLNPIFLWSLLGLSVPIAIHFWSKKKIKTIKIGSTQLLRELNPKQTRSIQLNQWFLLLLRMLILALITLILSVPYIALNSDEKRITYIVEPSLLHLDKVANIIDTISKGDIRILKNGFPLLDENRFEDGQKSRPNYWQLAQQMEMIQADSIVVITKALQTGFKGIRPTLSYEIHWLVIDEYSRSESPIRVLQRADQIEVTSSISDSESIKFESEIYTLDNSTFSIDNENDSISFNSDDYTRKLPLLKLNTTRVLMVYEEEFSTETFYLQAAFKALSKYMNRTIEVETVTSLDTAELASYEVLIWLRKDAAPSFTGKKLFWQSDELATDIVEMGTLQDQYWLTGHLNAENVVEFNLPMQLYGLVQMPEEDRALLDLADQRIMPFQEMQTLLNTTENAKKNMRRIDLSNWLWVALLLLLPAERILSKYRKQ